ncbi:hypothetical protein VNI00_018858 [Paramarasmius palmivorus]|uniref:Uncharacterized protein n=1 Tax=Paramarasmius palmivorus TaxID=297713 RepID=A0AAW0AU14_9AGAR
MTTEWPLFLFVFLECATVVDSSSKTSAARKESVPVDNLISLAGPRFSNNNPDEAEIQSMVEKLQDHIHKLLATIGHLQVQLRWVRCENDNLRGHLKAAHKTIEELILESAFLREELELLRPDIDNAEDEEEDVPPDSDDEGVTLSEATFNMLCTREIGG